ncbi:MAG: hypothetical protein AAGA54_36640, partial [Myxococcota bacterium]
MSDRRLLVVLAFGLLGPSCDEETGPSLREQAGLVAESVCRGAFACGCDNDSTDRYADEAACVTGIEDLIVERALDDVGLTFQSACVERVVAALDSYACEPEDTASIDGALFAASQQLQECRLFYGTGSAGAACSRLDGGLGDDCDAEHYCRDGACVRVGAGALDDACESDADCQASFRCLLSSETMRRQCSPQPSAGQACSDSGDCGPDAYCNAAAACAAIPGVGQSCAPSPSQTGLTCMPGSACANGVCEAGTGEGEACGVTCASGLECESG